MTILRRVLPLFILLMLCTLPSFAQQSLLQSLKPDHPRIMATSDDFAKLSTERETDAELDSILKEIEKSADSYLKAPLLERKMTGKRLLSVSREALLRITTLAVAYHSTGDERYAARAEAEMLNVCQFSDWNPNHYLDVAEMAAAVGLGYDWLYEYLPDDSRQKIHAGLREHALRLIKNNYWWKTCNHNWNSVCYGGMTIAALALAEDEPELARLVLEEVKKNNPRAVGCYEPDGVYPEGPGYWVYGTSYQVMLIDSLETALGTDMGLTTPALLASSQFVAHATGPTGLAYNYADGGDKVGTPAALYWFASRTNTPDNVNAVARLSGANRRDRMLPFAVLWRSPESQASKPLDLSWCGRGEQPLAMFRTSWTDPNALYLAAKAGRPNINHGHMDSGSFVLEADGIRWAIDLGAVNYNDYEQRGIHLFDHKQSGDRWNIFPYTNFGHNTITVDNQPYKVTGQSTFTDYKPLEQSTGSVSVDMAPVLALAKVEKATRDFTFDAKNRQVTVVDHLQGVKPQASIDWTMVTKADVAIDGHRIQLTQSGKTLQLTAISDTPGEWSVSPCEPPEGMYGDSKRDTRLIVWSAKAPDSGNYDLKVELTAGK
ncbi:heparinase II/III domain-containing protein [Aeoliella mucimassa]|uniref:Heparinase II/III-like protein n=1 Tax=Aeoliella mucimassa TaxID=2527972 RepID=A0A518AGU4_9BACT|nr:heparinase II/III family protein [Aeoliella mucimassa]QDU53948.1 Heparinase II/III-like protein [Aeoliella mucimassa]